MIPLDRLQNGKKLDNIRKETDTPVMYPRQIRPSNYVAPQKPKSRPSVGLFDLLKSDPTSNQPKSGAAEAFAAFQTFQQSSTNLNSRPSTATDFLTHWQNVTKVKGVHTVSMTRRMDSALRTVNMDGLKKVTRATNWRMKTFWFFLIFLLFGVCIFEMVRCINAYLDSPITTKFTLSTPDELDFPIVYLCYGNTVNRTYMQMHKDQLTVAKAYRSRAAVMVGGEHRSKRDVQEYLIDSNRAQASDVITAILQSVDDDDDLPFKESTGMWREGYRKPDVLPDYTAEDDDQYLTADYFDRAKRDAWNFEGNISNSNISKAEKAKAAAAEAEAANARLIDAMMNATNISDIVYQYFRDAAYSIDQTFLECEFRGYIRQKLNCSDIIKPIMDANYGMCFLVDLPDGIKQTVAGEGLRLLMNSHVDLYPQRAEGPPRYAGVLISINKEYDPFNWLKSLATAGRLTKIDLESSYVELLNLDSGPLIQRCVSEHEGQSQLKVFKANYTRTICQVDCIYQAHRNLCQCVIPVDKSQIRHEIINDTSFCTPRQFNNCLSVSANLTDQMAAKCRESCHTPCKSYRYEMRSSYAKLYEPAFSKYPLPPNVTPAQLIELRVAHSRMEISQFIQNPSASMADLIANFGGQINLWLGASLISLIQLMSMAFGFIGWRIFLKIRHLRKRYKHSN